MRRRQELKVLDLEKVVNDTQVSNGKMDVDGEDNALHQKLQELNILLVQANRDLKVEREKYNEMIVVNQKQESKLEDLGKHIEIQAKESEVELYEIEKALFKVEKELKAERNVWNAKEVELERCLKLERSKRKILEEGLSVAMQQREEELEVDVEDENDAADTIEDTISVEENEPQIKILTNRLTLLQEQVLKLRENESKYVNRLSLLQQKIVELNKNLDEAERITEDYRMERKNLLEQIERTKTQFTIERSAELARNENLLDEQRQVFEKEKSHLEAKLKRLEDLESKYKQETTLNDDFIVANEEVTLYEVDASIDKAHEPPKKKRLSLLKDRVRMFIRCNRLRLLDKFKGSEQTQEEREKSYIKNLKKCNNANII